MTNDESSQASLPDAYAEPDVTQSVPGFQPPPPAAAYPGAPAWSAPAVSRRARLREAAVLGTSIGLSLALVLGLPAAVVTLTPVGRWVGFTQPRDAVAAASQPGGSGETAAAGAAAPDLREGAVFLQSNNPSGNEVVAFARGGDGRLTLVGRYPTGGLGSGSFEDSAGAMVLGTSEGSASPTQVVDKAELLFVPDVGSDSITVFRVSADKLELASRVSSGGVKPVSLTVSKGLLYVLNSGEVDDRFLLSETEAIENCTTGQLPSVTGFRISPDGNLTPIENSTRLLSEQKESGCAQALFSPDGQRLVVTERIANVEGSEEANSGAIVTFSVRKDGTLGNRQIMDPEGIGPFGFNFTKDGKLVTAESTRALANPGGGHVASYTPGPNNTWQTINGSVANFQTDTCWIAITDNQRLMFTSGPFPGTIASYTLDPDGALTLVHSVASAKDGKDDANDYVDDAVTDIALDRDTRWLYAVNSNEGAVTAFEVNPDGSLTFVDRYAAFDQPQVGEGGELDSFGIAVF